MVRSSTFWRIFSSSVRCWAGARSSSKTTASAPAAATRSRELGDLAAADERRGVGRVALLHDALDHHRAGRVEQRLELVQRRVDLLVGDAGQLHADDDRLLDPADDVDALAGGALLDDLAAPTAFLGAGQGGLARGGVVVVDRVQRVAVREVGVGRVRGGAGVVVGVQPRVLARRVGGLPRVRLGGPPVRSVDRGVRQVRARSHASARVAVATSSAGPVRKTDGWSSGA